SLDGAPDSIHGARPRLVLPLVDPEIQSHVLEIEARLRSRIEPLEQLLQPAPARDDDGFAAHFRSRFSSRSGETLRLPTLLALAAISWNACAIICRGSRAARTCSARVSMVRSGATAAPPASPCPSPSLRAVPASRVTSSP